MWPTFHRRCAWIASRSQRGLHSKECEAKQDAVDGQGASSQGARSQIAVGGVGGVEDEDDLTRARALGVSLLDLTIPTT